jgi:predicted transcriptional regulator
VATELHKAGNSFRDVGKWLGVHASTVRQYLIRAGIEPRERKGRQNSCRMVGIILRDQPSTSP